MSADAVYVLCVLLATIGLFVSDRVRLDVVALLATLALFLGGQISADQAVAGLGDSVVVLIAALFVVGEALYRTGVAHAVGRLLVRYAGSGESRLIALMMLAVAFLSAFMSSTGAVAVFIPIALGLAASTGVPRERLLMPLAVGAMIGGMLTLIGTPPNLVVTGELSRAGLEPFEFFDFTPIGLAVLVVGIAWMALVGGRLVRPQPEGEERSLRPTIPELVAAHEMTGEVLPFAVDSASPLAGRSLREADIFRRHGVTVAAIRTGGRFRTAWPDMRPAPGDLLLATGEAAALERFRRDEALSALPLTPDLTQAADADLGVVEVLVSPQSRAVGRTLVEADFRGAYGLFVHAVRRRGERVRSAPAALRLQGGDVLLMSGTWNAIRRLDRDRPNLFVLRLPSEADEAAPARSRAPTALAVTALMMALLAFNIVPSVIAVLLAALAMVVGGCLDMNAAYRSINWQSVVLIAFMLPMATALDGSGALDLGVQALVDATGDLGPMALLAALFVLTSLLSQVISNTATTVLVAPVALAAGQQVGVAPEPLLMGVAIAASTAFSTPVASPVNTLVLGPRRYRYMDFVKVAVPLQLLALALALVLVPLLFPF